MSREPDVLKRVVDKYLDARQQAAQHLQQARLSTPGSPDAMSRLLAAHQMDMVALGVATVLANVNPGSGARSTTELISENHRNGGLIMAVYRSIYAKAMAQEPQQ